MRGSALQCLRKQSRFLSGQSLLERKQQETVNGIFRRRMEIAGVNPQDRIAIAVSGGVDSMALCLLAVEWKKHFSAAFQGLVGFTVHPENGAQVQKWLSDIGIRCEILEREEREGGRYVLLHDACRRDNISVLLASDQGDDLALLTIWRLSRALGLNGLASIPFVNELVPRTRAPEAKALRVVKPLVDFYKSDLYEVCKRAGQDWIEHRETSIVAKTINFPEMSSLMRNEIQNLVRFFRKQHAQLEAEKNNLLRKVARADMSYGYVIVDLNKLFPLKDAVTLLGAIFRFVQQTAQIPRKRDTLKALEWLKENNTNNLRVGDCLLSRLDDSELLVTFSPKLTTQSKTPPKQRNPRPPSRSDQETEDSRRIRIQGILAEPTKNWIISEETSNSLTQLCLDIVKAVHQRNEQGKTPGNEENEEPEKQEEAEDDPAPREEENVGERGEILSGTSCYFMNRFHISWQEVDLGEMDCKACFNGGCCLAKAGLRIRLLTAEDLKRLEELVTPEMWVLRQRLRFLHRNVKLALPVVVSADDILISLPSIGLQFCSRMKFTSRFLPRFSLSNDHMQWL